MMISKDWARSGEQGRHEELDNIMRTGLELMDFDMWSVPRATRHGVESKVYTKERNAIRIMSDERKRV